MERQSTSKLFRIALAVVAFFVLCTSAVLFSSCKKEEAHQHVYSYIDAVATPTGSDDESPSVTYTCEICGDQITVPIAPSSVTMQRIQDVLTQHSSNLEGVLTKLNAGRLADLQNVLQSEIRNLDDATSAKLNAAIENFSASVREYNSSVESAHNDIANAIETQTSNVQHLNDVLSQVYSFIYGVAPTAEDPTDVTTEPTLGGNSLNNYLSFLSNYVKYLKYLVGQDSEALSALAEDVSSIKDAVIDAEDKTKTVISEVKEIATAISGIAGSIGTPTEGKTIFELLEKIAKALPESGSSSHSHALVLVPDKTLEGPEACTSPVTYHYECIAEGDCDLDLGDKDTGWKNSVTLPPKGHTIVWVDLDELKTATPTGSDGNYGPDDESKHGYPLQGITEHYRNATCIAPAQVEGYCTSCKQWTGIWSSVGSPTYQHNYVLENEDHEGGCKFVHDYVYHCTTCGGAYVEKVTGGNPGIGGGDTEHYYYTCNKEQEMAAFKEYYLQYVNENPEITSVEQVKESMVEGLTSQQKYAALNDYLNIVSQTSETCTEPGLIVVECVYCHMRYAYSYGQPSGHKWHEVSRDLYKDIVDACTLGALNADDTAKLWHCNKCGYFTVSVNSPNEKSIDYAKNAKGVFFNHIYAESGEEPAKTHTDVADDIKEIVNAVKTAPQGHTFVEDDKYKVVVEKGDCTTTAVSFYVCSVCGLADASVEGSTLQIGDKYVNLKADPTTFEADYLNKLQGENLYAKLATKATAGDVVDKKGYTHTAYTTGIDPTSEAGKAFLKAYEENLAKINATLKTAKSDLTDLTKDSLKENVYLGYNIARLRFHVGHDWLLGKGEENVSCVSDKALTILWKDWVDEDGVTTSTYYTMTGDEHDVFEGKPVSGVTFTENYKGVIDYLAAPENAYNTVKSKLDPAFVDAATKYGIVDWCRNETCPKKGGSSVVTAGVPVTAGFVAAVDHSYGVFVFEKGSTGKVIGASEGEGQKLFGTEFDKTVYTREQLKAMIASHDDNIIKNLSFLQSVYMANKGTLYTEADFPGDAQAKGKATTANQQWMTDWATEIAKITGTEEGHLGFASLDDLYVRNGVAGPITCRVVERCKWYDGTNCKAILAEGQHLRPEAGSVFSKNCQHGDLCPVCGTYEWNRKSNHNLVKASEIVDPTIKAAFEKLTESWKDSKKASCWEEGADVYLCTGCLMAGVTGDDWKIVGYDYTVDPDISADDAIRHVYKTQEARDAAVKQLWADGHSFDNYNYYIEPVKKVAHTFAITDDNMLAIRDLFGVTGPSSAPLTAIADIKAAILQGFSATWKDDAHTIVDLGEGFTLSFGAGGRLTVKFEIEPTETYVCVEESYSYDICLVCAARNKTNALANTATIRTTTGDHPTDTVKTLGETKENGHYADMSRKGHAFAPLKDYKSSSVYHVDPERGAWVPVICLRCGDRGQGYPEDFKNDKDFDKTNGTWAPDEWIEAAMGPDGVTKEGIKGGQAVQKLDAVDATFEALAEGSKLSETITKLTDGGTIGINEDVTLGEDDSAAFNAAGKEFVLELADGVTLTSESHNLTASAGASLTIKGGSLDVKAEKDGADTTAPAVLANGEGTVVTLEGVTIINTTDGAALHVQNNATMIVNNCKIFTYGKMYNNMGIEVNSGRLEITDSYVATLAMNKGDEDFDATVKQTAALGVFGGTVVAKNTVFASPCSAVQIQIDNYNGVSGTIDATFTDCKFLTGLMDTTTLAVDETKVTTTGTKGNTGAFGIFTKNNFVGSAKVTFEGTNTFGKGWEDDTTHGENPAPILVYNATAGATVEIIGTSITKDNVYVAGKTGTVKLNSEAL